MTATEREELIRQYAAGALSWRELRERGVEDYVQVLAGLGELGLRPPLVPPGGPNRLAREKGVALLRTALGRQ